MISLTKMDIYRLFKTKTLYIVWGVLIFAIFFFTFIFSELLEDMDDISMTVRYSMNTLITIFSVFIAIFSVIFTTADINTGYIKNIGGQLSSRKCLIFSKAVGILIFTVLSFVLFVMIEIVANAVFVGKVDFDGVARFFKYVAIETLLVYALALVCMTLATVIKKTAVATAISIILAFGMIGSLLNPAIDSFVQDAGIENFLIEKYTLLGNMVIFSNVNNADIPRTIIVALCYIIICLAINCYVFSKRDIV